MVFFFRIIENNCIPFSACTIFTGGLLASKLSEMKWCSLSLSSKLDKVALLVAWSGPCWSLLEPQEAECAQAEPMPGVMGTSACKTGPRMTIFVMQGGRGDLSSTG